MGKVLEFLKTAPGVGIVVGLWKWLRRFWVRYWQNIFLFLILAVIFSIAVWGYPHRSCLLGLIGLEKVLLDAPDWFAFWGTAAGSSVLFFNMLYRNAEIYLQKQKQIDERFNAAISLLGSSEATGRGAALYPLYYLAVEHEKYRKTIVHILCSHIRSITSNEEYKKKYKDLPSEEIQTVINLLFCNKSFRPQGLNKMFPSESFPIVLTYSYLAGADFSNTFCQNVLFFYSECQGANFFNAECQYAKFDLVNLTNTNFSGAQLNGAYFSKEHFDVVKLSPEQKNVVNVLDWSRRGEPVTLERKNHRWKC